MYIKSIVLDGFKSYGNRVEVNGFDPMFNAITGLNGTGKSNILDSICFVLGITNLGHVRASSLQELVYKNGQAGITKATVSITFDNRNKNQSPIGYESHDEITVTRQVVIGGKNKYLINGINVQNKRVSDLFCSVQLNVNNPHFLIMQGRITKVLNMKPPEILSMVEEAAGTRMYESKKQAAEKTIAQKDAKLAELNDIIKEDIEPKLNRLQEERMQFQEYQKVVRELENLTRLYVAYRYVTAEEKVKKAANNVQTVQDDIQGRKDAIKNNDNESQHLQENISELSKKLDEESGSILKELETELQGREKAEAGASSQHKGAADAVASHAKRARLLAKSVRDDESALASKQKVLDDVSTMFESLKSTSEKSAAELEEAQKRFLAISSGCAGDSGEASLQDQLIAAKQEASEASTRVTQAGMEKKYAEDRLKSLQKTFGASSAQYTKDKANIDKMQREVDALQSDLTRMNFDESRYAELKESTRTLQSTLRRTRDQLDNASARLQDWNVRYQDPEPNFDRRRVKGTVCRLFDVPDPTYSAALEKVAGAKLSNVVTDTEATGSLLLERGRLQKRITIIPLNKIQARVLDRSTLHYAQHVGGGPQNVQLALDLIRFDPEVRSAMAFVFGQTLVCSDLDTARRVCYDPKVKCRCVTLDGDVCDPWGTMGGGAPDKSQPILIQIQKLNDMENDVKKLEQTLLMQNAELQNIQQLSETYSSKKQRYDLMSHELEIVKERLKSTSHHQMSQEIEGLQAQVQSLTAAIEQDKTLMKAAAEKAKELEAKVKDIKGHREREFKKAEDALKKAKKKAEQSSIEWKNREQEFETLRLEVEDLQKSVETSRSQLESEQQSAVQLEAQVEETQRAVKEAKERVKEIQDQIKRQRAEIASRSSDIAKLQKKKEALAARNNELNLEIKELQYKLTEVQADTVEQEKKIKALEKEHPWIAGERQFFGARHGLYDWEERGVDGDRLQQLRERKEQLGRGLNARAHTLLEKEEETFRDTLHKKKIVEQDRAKLIKVIAELDEKKRQTLVKACEHVNVKFSSIFSSLLPGAQAKLKPPDGLTVLDGLEVKVGFNNAWKESLGELSGGQRSLVALSLILAMLLFKPAPLYILDEVDAALDLSHTQNIGTMLKEHFKHSQFIIVSLKEGMFNNANVLFQTRFVDGMSSVQRTANKKNA